MGISVQREKILDKLKVHVYCIGYYEHEQELIFVDSLISTRFNVTPLYDPSIQATTVFKKKENAVKFLNYLTTSYSSVPCAIDFYHIKCINLKWLINKFKRNNYIYFDEYIERENT